MNKINVRRVLLGGLGAGLIITLGLMGIQGAMAGEPPTFSPSGAPAHPVITYMAGPDLGPKLLRDPLRAARHGSLLRIPGRFAIGQVHDLEVDRDDLGEMQLLDEAGGPLEHRAQARGIRAGGGDAEHRTLPGILASDFGDRDIEVIAQTLGDGTHHTTPLLQRL